MGTSQALVGAYVLAGELKAAAGDHRTAFARYERELRPYVEGCQKLAMTNQPKQTRFAQWSMVQGMRLLPHLPFKRRLLAAGTRPMTEAANAVTLRAC
ncbi:hypothetical protein [Amycolatopsis sp. H20-H5]|uniref:hypothetical protein n=1 Tax=Amycolatopsis sp. H20-H5 TaxID=3046309 RepID=UPI002DB590C1|nr:hypothetical protein [Amycolatopsis sp. H20-H5]MEC3977076.1 hypothetical protein [Amycolatopsis sp. H20-H5]